MNKIQWLAHPMHLCVSDRCQFRLATLVNDTYVVSTIGEFYPEGIYKKMESVAGDKDNYETMVFRATSKRHDCGCPEVEGGDLDCRRYCTAIDAVKGHNELIRKWSDEATA